MSTTNDATAGHRGDVASAVTVFAPGRVNLIGDHVDYAGGPVLPIAIELGTTIRAERTPGTQLWFRTDISPDELRFDVQPTQQNAQAAFDGDTMAPHWGNAIVVAARLRGWSGGLRGTLTTTLPVGAGLSSSASYGVAAVLMIEALTSPQAAARLLSDPLRCAKQARKVEHLATGVPSGLMDQLAIAAGKSGHATLFDCESEAIEPIPLPETLAITVTNSGQSRTLASSEYGMRTSQVAAAANLIGALSTAHPSSIAEISDPVIAARARHVITECQRVRDAATALRAGEVDVLGDLMNASHRSLAEDFGVSTPVLDALTESLRSRPGVYGSRLTGAGFGGCVVSAHRPDVVLPGWRLQPSSGPTIEFDP